jgi:adenylate kinase family enzyme
MRILITGAAGTGTTTLAQALAQELGSAFFDADNYYWLPSDPPFQHKRDPVTRFSLLLHDLRAVDSAVIGGSIMNWGVELEESLEFVVFLTVPAEIRVERLRERELRRFGRIDPAFIEWAAQYEEGRLPGRSLQRHESWLALRSCPILRIDGDTSTEDRLARTLARIRQYSPGA